MFTTNNILTDENYQLLCKIAKQYHDVFKSMMLLTAKSGQAIGIFVFKTSEELVTWLIRYLRTCTQCEGQYHITCFNTFSDGLKGCKLSKKVFIPDDRLILDKNFIPIETIILI